MDRFKNILVIYDEDEAGIQASKILKAKFDSNIGLFLKNLK